MIVLYTYPRSWEARMTPTGQIYYANHVTRSTQWSRPTAAAAPAVQDGAAQAQARRQLYERRSVLTDLRGEGMAID
jgi:E3 ubiquitin-protein ligase NEDD4